MHRFQELLVWQKARKLVKHTYQISSDFPKQEMFGLTAQMRRASVSVPSNIAEGCGRGTNAQFNHFLNIASGSAAELSTQFYLAFDLGFINEEIFNKSLNQSDEIQKMLYGLMKSNQAKSSHHT